MTATDWIIDLLIVALVLRQIREERFRALTLLLPLAGVAYAAHTYLHTIPTTGNDLTLIALLTGLGAALGIAGGLTTHIRNRGGTRVTIQASATSAALWITSTGGRLAFIIWTTHGGAPTLTHFSTAHHITSANAWSAALILMVCAEIATRMGLITARALRARHTPQPTTHSTAPTPLLATTH